MSSGRSNPLKPLIFGMLAMGLAAIVALTIRGVISLQEQEARRQEQNRREREATQQRWRDEQAQRQAAEARRRSEAEARQLREKAADERRLAAEAAAKTEKASREAAEAAARAEQAKRRTIDVTVAFTKKLHQAQAGDPNAQHLIGYIYYLGMDRIVGTGENRLAIYNRTVITMLIGEDPEIRPLVSVPTFKQNDEVAAKWFERAALQGHRGAQTYLGITNAGRGKYDLAYLWMLIADGPALPDEINLPKAPAEVRKSMKETFRKRLTPEQAAEAEKKAKEFKAKKEEA